MFGIFINTVTPSSGVPGDTVVVTGSGFTPGGTVKLGWDGLKAWDGEKGVLNLTTAKASSTFEVWFDVPEAESGDHYIWVRARDRPTQINHELFNSPARVREK